MTALDLLLLVLGIVSVIPCSYLYIKDKSNAFKVLMILSFIAGPIWAVAIVLFRNATTQELVLIYGKIIYINSIFLGLSFYFFEQYFPKKKIHNSFFTGVILLIAGFLVFTILTNGNFILSPVLEKNNALVLGRIYLVWMIWMLGIFSYGLFNILRGYQNLGKIEKHQLKYFIFAILIPIIGVVPTNAIFPLIGNFSLIWVGPVAMSIMSMLLTLGIATKTSNNKYAILVSIYKILGIIIFILGISMLNIWFISRFESISSPIEKGVLIFLFVLLGVLIFFTGNLLFEKSINILFKDKIPDYVALRDRYLNITSESLHLNNLINVSLEELMRSISVIWSGIVIEQEEGKLVYFHSEKGHKFNLKESYNLLVLNVSEILNELNGICNRDSLEYILNNDYEKYSTKLLKKMEYVSNTLISLDASEVMLIRGAEQPSGLFFIGYKKGSSASLNNKERELIISLLNNLSLGIARAELHKQVELANDSLQQKVNEQTQELQIKVKQLEEARRKENDMIDIMGHELRTPATVVKLNIELLKKYIDSNPEEFKKYIDRIGNAVDTEIGLINTLLTSAKLEGNKVEIKHNKVDVKEEIEMSIHGHEKEVREGVSISKDIEQNLPFAYADKIRVAEVLNNLISNAIKYTDKGNISVIAHTQGDYIVVSIKDTGKGISQEDMKQLGEKFYRVDNYLESEIVRPGGTGLGLYVTFGLVKLMGGKIEVESTQGVGSKFTFTLPKYKGQQVEVLGTVNRFEKLGLKR